jgi:S-adenosylmethionine:tRNA ribosyltransferase-isomerase
MKTSDFDYNLPLEFIAQTPVEPRDSSRLLVLNRETGTLEHRSFRDIGEYLHPRDLLVVNRTRVIPARIYARKPTGGRVEILLLRREDLLTWECLVGGKGLSAGKKLMVVSDDPGSMSVSGSPKSTDFGLRGESGDSGLHAEIIETLEGSRRRIRFEEPIEPYFSKVGNLPLPPYIHEPLKDPERYQTVYARDPGSAAAPTAGLHFTPRLMNELRSQGVNFSEVTLHVGLDTFAPVTEDDPEEHQIHTEWCEISPATVEAITQTRRTGGRIIAVGTTSVRTLESAAKAGKNSILPYSGPTNLYILPGYQFKLVDAMITNFHLPKSTLIMLVSAFAGREQILQAYETAKQEHYRFYSFGDAMFIY